MTDLCVEKFYHDDRVFFVLPPAHPLFRETKRLVATEFSSTAGTDPRNLSIHAYRWHVCAPTPLEADLIQFIRTTYYEDLPVCFDGLPLYRTELHAAFENTKRMTLDLKDMTDLRAQVERDAAELTKIKAELAKVKGELAAAEKQVEADAMREPSLRDAVWRRIRR